MAKYCIQQFKTEFPDDDACLQAILKRRYGDIECCPKCGVVSKLTRIAKRRAFACSAGCHIYPCAGTIFEHSSTPLTLWFHAMYLMSTTRNGVAGRELERQLGVTPKCAWRIGHQLRNLMAARDKAQSSGPLTGHMEADETYVGGEKKYAKGKGQALVNKSVVVGVVKRKGAVRGKVIPNERKETIVPFITANVAAGSILSTDMHKSHKKLGRHGFKHGVVNHRADEWRRGIHHTNTIEGFWSHLKRAIRSTHVHVSKRYLQRYVDEFAFRYNNRTEPAQMFHRMLAQILPNKNTK